jgi:hypothetical protein
MGFSLSDFDFLLRWQKSKEDRLKPVLLVHRMSCVQIEVQFEHVDARLAKKA